MTSGDHQRIHRIPINNGYKLDAVLTNNLFIIERTAEFYQQVTAARGSSPADRRTYLVEAGGFDIACDFVDHRKVGISVIQFTAWNRRAGRQLLVIDCNEPQIRGIVRCSADGWRRIEALAATVKPAEVLSLPTNELLLRPFWRRDRPSLRCPGRCLQLPTRRAPPEIAKRCRTGVRLIAGISSIPSGFCSAGSSPVRCRDPCFALVWPAGFRRGTTVGQSTRVTAESWT